LAGLFPDQIVYLASACNYDASEKEMECGGLMVVFENMYGLHQSYRYSDIIVLLVLNWEHV
jgi:hypothetical protein